MKSAMRAERAALLVIIALTLWRVALLWVNRTDLYVDEAQYWFWSATPDWGYFSKPPLIAWIIGLSTWIGGSDAPFWIRLPAPLLHALAAGAVGGIGAQIADRRIGALAAVSYAVTPGVSLGSQLISTDTAALPFFALAIWLWLRLAGRPSPRDAVLCGAALGLGFLAKYAAAYAIPGAALAALFAPRLRPRLRDVALAGAAFGMVIAGNLLWNARNGFITAAHTAHNAAADQGFALHWAEAGDFLAAQLLVMGPILFPALLWAGWAATGRARALVWFSLPIVALVTLQGLRAEANINWAAMAYAPGAALAVAALPRRLLAASLALTGAIAVLMPLTALSPGSFARQGERGIYARVLAREEVALEIAARARAFGAQAILSDKRSVLAAATHALRGGDLPVYAPPPEGAPDNSYEMRAALPDGFSGPALFVGGDPTRLPRIVRAVPAGEIAPPVGGWMKWPLALWRVEISATAP